MGLGEKKKKRAQTWLTSNEAYKPISDKQACTCTASESRCWRMAAITISMPLSAIARASKSTISSYAQKVGEVGYKIWKFPSKAQNITMKKLNTHSHWLISVSNTIMVESLEWFWQSKMKTWWFWSRLLKYRQAFFCTAAESGWACMAARTNSTAAPWQVRNLQK